MIFNVIVGVVHVFACLFLITFILLHSGRGSGLSDMFGGSAAGGAMAGGTVVERNLDRMTIVAALIFTFTTVFLGLRLQSGSATPVGQQTGDTTVTTPSEQVPTEQVPTDQAPSDSAPADSAPADAPASTQAGG